MITLRCPGQLGHRGSHSQNRTSYPYVEGGPDYPAEEAGTVRPMRIRRIALISAAAAAIGGLVWWKKARDDEDEFDEEAMLLDISSTNGAAPEFREASKSELPL